MPIPGDPIGGGGPILPPSPTPTNNPPHAAPPPAPAPANPAPNNGPGAPNYNAAWRAWAQGVLVGIGAPLTDVNLANLWAWTAFESPTTDPMRWNNPLNTTQDYPGAVSQNSVGVKSYPTLGAGITATDQTLLNGYYPYLVQSLRSSTPRANWSAQVLANLRTWGSKSFANNIGGNVGAPTGGGSSQSNGTPASTNDPAAALADPFGIGSALGSFGTALGKDITGGLEIVVGAILMLVGIGILVLMAVKGAAPAASKVAQLATPAGRALGAARAATRRAPKAAPVAVPAKAKPVELSPGAQASIAAAKAGRGSKLSPSVKAELRQRAA